VKETKIAITYVVEKGKPLASPADLIKVFDFRTVSMMMSPGGHWRHNAPAFVCSSARRRRCPVGVN